MFSRLVVASAAAVVLSAAAPAQAQVIADWAPADVRPILLETGSTVAEEGRLDQGQPFLRMTSSRGLKYWVTGEACVVGPNKRCRGVHIYASFDMDSEAEVLTQARGLDYSAVRFIASGKSLIGERYLILDHGITRANFKTNVEVFLEVMHKVWDKLAQ